MPTDGLASAGSTALAAISSFDSWLSSSSTGYYIRLYGYFYAICIVASLWTFHVARKLQPGLQRALVCLPIVVLQLAATPVLVDRHRTAVLVVPVMGILSLAAFKVAAFAMGRGPLALPDCPWLQELPRFGAVLSFPIIPRAVFKVSKGATADALSSSAPTTPSTFLYTYCCKAGGATVAAALAVWPVLPQLLNHWFYALCLSLSLGAIWDFWCLVAVLWFGVEAAPSFDKPWLSTSFADYWSRRWNLTTTYMLRVLIYEPIMEGSSQIFSSDAAAIRAAKRQRMLRRLAALQATFAFSGLWHLLIFYYATGLVTYHWFLFFSLQAPIMAAEAILVKWAKQRQLLLRRPAAIFLTNFLLIVVARPLFFGPCDWSGMCTAMFDNVKGYFV
ncbi:hypothetical protein OEZ85_010353 [Tetradesmus obliquus]|uniref:Wax synthase domain-containing protein n=1 Tax=Tetradesmus obliquus TaxID=3088 RepID=A0ABY8TP65_TETOB|nr:hypothetical protein OEZ85_010353 [Tetradesmus obliquus]